MEFLNPFFLFFIPLSLLPIILNILFKNTRNEIPFPLYFLIGKRQKGRGLNVRNIIKTVLRMLIILDIIFIFAHPVSGYRDSSKLIIFDNSAHSEITYPDGTRVIDKGLEVLRSVFREGDKIVVMDDAHFRMLYSPEGIAPVKRNFDIPIWDELPAQVPCLLISPMTFAEDFKGPVYDLFPDDFVNIGISVKDFSVLLRRINVRVYSQSYTGAFTVSLKTDNSTRTVHRGSFDKTSEIDLEIEMPAPGGRITLAISADGIQDAFTADNSAEMFLPGSLRFNDRTAYPMISRMIETVSGRLKNGGGGSYVLEVSNIETERPGLYFMVSGTAAHDSCFFTLARDQQPFQLAGIPLDIEGRTIVEGMNGNPYLVISGKKRSMFFGFLPDEGENPFLGTDQGLRLMFLSLDEYLKSLVREDHKVLFSAQEINRPVVHRIKGRPEKKDPGMPFRDHKPLLLTVLFVLMILDLFI